MFDEASLGRAIPTENDSGTDAKPASTPQEVSKANSPDISTLNANHIQNLTNIAENSKAWADAARQWLGGITSALRETSSLKGVDIQAVRDILKTIEKTNTDTEINLMILDIEEKLEGLSDFAQINVEPASVDVLASDEPTIEPGTGEPKSDVDVGREHVGQLGGELKQVRVALSDLETQIAAIDPFNPDHVQISVITEGLNKVSEFASNSTRALDRKISFFKSQQAIVGITAERFEELEEIIDLFEQSNKDFSDLQDVVKRLEDLVWEKSVLSKYPAIAELYDFCHLTREGNWATDLRTSVDDSPEYSVLNSGQKNIALHLTFRSNLQSMIAQVEEGVLEMSLPPDRLEYLTKNFIDKAKQHLRSVEEQLLEVVRNNLVIAFPEHFDASSPNSLSSILNDAEDKMASDAPALNRGEMEDLVVMVEGAWKKTREEIRTFVKTHMENSSAIDEIVNHVLSEYERRVEKISNQKKENEGLIELYEEKRVEFDQGVGWLKAQVLRVSRLEPPILTVQEDLISSKFEDIDAKLAELRERFSPFFGNSGYERLLEEYNEVRKSIIIAKYRFALGSALKTMSNYEMENIPIQTFYQEFAQTFSNQVYDAVDALIQDVSEIDAELSSRMRRKFDKLKERIGNRTLLYDTVDRLMETVVAVRKNVRSYPDSDVGVRNTNKVFDYFLNDTYSPIEYGEDILLPNETESNPVVIMDSYFYILAGQSVEDDEDTFNGATIVSRPREGHAGELLGLRTQSTKNHLLMLMVGEALSGGERFRTNYKTIHSKDVYEAMPKLMKQDVLPVFIEEVVIPHIVDFSFFHKRADEDGIDVGSSEYVDRVRVWTRDPELIAERGRVRSELMKTTANEIKQAIIALLPTCFSQTYCEGSAGGISDGIFYLSNLDYLGKDVERATAETILMRYFMFAPPESFSIWTALDNIIGELRKSRIDRFTMPAGSFQEIVSMVVDRHGADKYQHLKNGCFTSLINMANINPNSTAFEQHPTKPGLLRKKFNKLVANVHVPAFDTPLSYLHLSSTRNDKRRRREGFGADGDILTALDAKDINGFFRWELLKEAFMPSDSDNDMTVHLGQVAPKIKELYAKLFKKERAKIGEVIVSQDEAKTIFYAMYGMPGEIGDELRAKTPGYNEKTLTRELVETILLADALTMAFRGSSQEEVEKMIDGTGSAVLIESKVVIKEIISNVFGKSMFAEEIFSTVIDQFVEALKVD